MIDDRRHSRARWWRARWWPARWWPAKPMIEPMNGTPPRPGGDRGAVTAEFAVAMPALILLLGFSLGAVDAALDKVRCVDAARDAALVQARGGDGRAAGLAEAPTGATVVITSDGDLVRVTVTVRSRPLGQRLPGVYVVGTAVTVLEPATGP